MLPLIPLISLAGSLVPELATLLGGRRAGEVAGRVAEVVREITGTDDMEAAARALQADAGKAGALRQRLEEIRERYLALQFQDAEAERQALLARLRSEIEDRARASGTMVAALDAPGWPAGVVALTPVLLSAIVLLGFFLFTAWLVQSPPGTADPTALTLLNVVIGALVAGFTAVVNFWLGSSQGSREKDRLVAALQGAPPRPVAEPEVPPRPAPVPPAAAAPAAPALPGQPTRFDLCLEVVLEKEGGFANHPADPGGATMLGITQRSLAAWRGRPVTEAEVRALTREEAKEIYRALYWNVMRCEDLPRGIDLMVFDCGVNAGPATAVRMLQRAVGAAADGAVGPVTLQAVRRAEARPLIEALARARQAHYEALEHFRTFGSGWTRRVEAVRRQALLMAAS
ncbi:glycoside hydrolase family 108 protein [Roseicella aerolata]|uniref:Peptidoglycan binding protein n=1 Tax=Roseicella aerolata TaxID=2883479 RepID=A0A9X1IBH5_9PROT|nr:glycosyl hydrolase 108 family protein [Roseicella aerolata]MCB4821734.1 hypothetical protein [Roseicella aerolata]